MASKPETTFYTSVHRHLPPETAFWREKMANPYRGGTADHWYSGRGKKSRDLWVEWKYIRLPARPGTMIDLVNGRAPPLSHLQQSWLSDRYLEGRNVWVIVGSDANGGVIFQSLEWERPLPASEFRRRLLSRKDIAQQILAFAQGMA
jgi:hypothetical protein